MLGYCTYKFVVCCSEMHRATVQCKYCSFTNAKRLVLWHHYKLCHAHHVQGVPCIAKDACPQRFKSYASFRSHCSRTHNNEDAAAVERCELQCSRCKVIVVELESYLAHLRKHVCSHEYVECPYEGCSFGSNVSTTFRSHLSRSHCKNASLIKSHLLLVQPSCNNESTIREHEQLEESVSGLDSDEFLEDTSLMAESVDDDAEQKVLHSAASLCLTMQCVFNIPSTTVDEILKSLNTINTFDGVQLCHKIEDAIQELGYNDSQLVAVIKKNVLEQNIFVKCTGKSTDVCSSVQGMLSTNDRRMTYYKTHFPYVAPVEYKLGYKFGRNHSFVYVPIISSLQKLLAIPEILGEVIKEYVRSEGVYTSYEDGSYYQANELFQTHKISLKLGLYHDDWESVNPLGTARKKHKVSAFYWVLLNLSPSHRSALKVIQLCLLAKSQDVRDFSLAAVLEPLLNDISILETEGVFIESLGQTIFGTVAYVTADNLAAHTLGGFNESFGPSVNRFCRFCDARSSDISDVSKNVSSFNLRSKTEYDEQAELRLGSLTGVKFASPLHGKLKYFHVVFGLPPDVAHDLLEGIVPLELYLCLTRLISRGYFSLDFLNKQLKSFKFYGQDQTNRPQVISLGKDAKTVGGNAHENWSLLRVLPLLVGSHAPDGDPAWGLILYLKAIVEISFSPVVSRSAIAFLDMLIQEHKLLLRETFPDFTLKPKHHFIEHYPYLMTCFGPLALASTLRFESKHSFLKKSLRQMMNYRNICKSLANRHQLYQALQMSDTEYLKPAFVAHHDPSFLPLSAISSHMQNTLTSFCDNHGIFTYYKSVTVHGTNYKQNMAVALGVDGGLVSFGIILMIVVNTKGDCCFVCCTCKCFYSQHLHCYELERTDDVVLVKHTELLDYYPLAVYRIDGKNYVTMKHFVCSFHPDSL